APEEVRRLKALIAKAGNGEMFVLHGGDCAERFIDCNEESITNHLKIILQMSVILMYGMRKPAVRIGRIAGQYAKPRSNGTEVVNGQELPSYRGDCVNGFEATPASRLHDPERLRQSYFHSALTLNYIRSIINSGFADLHHPHNWNLNSIEKTSKWAEYQKILDRILDAINFMEAFGGVRAESLGRVDMFTSHEGLILNYEEALTRRDPASGRYYNLGAHMLWLGERTRVLCQEHGFAVGDQVAMTDGAVAAWNTLITNVNVSAVSATTITIAPDSSSTAAFTSGTLRSNFSISVINETAGSDAGIYIEEIVQGHPGL
ncbi:MAG: 3-deoxy-7-phosphoheptulonate synthase, partial [SAR324 cluster bacterium]|nr:3-deoxy-7-phosphoheptulonate synthase [SAR324 cluster bacterium]